MIESVLLISLTARKVVREQPRNSQAQLGFRGMLRNVKLLSFVAGLLFIFLIGVSSFITLITLRNTRPQFPPSKDSLTKAIPKPFVVYSGSMEPAIKTASLIFAMPSTKYVAGDIITFTPPNNTKTTITHRINFKTFENGLENPTYITSGDNNEDIDKWKIANDNIIGKVRLTIPYAGYIVDFAKTPQGFILFVIVPATIIVYEELKYLRKNILSIKGKYINKAYVVLPIIGAFIVFIGLSSSLFLDTETSENNTVGISTEFEITPTPTEVP